MSTPEEKAQAQEDAAVRAAEKKLFLERLETAMTGNLISGMEIYQFLSEHCGMGATDAQRESVSEHHDVDDDCEVDGEAWVSEADNGYWVHAWLWVPVEQKEDEPKEDPED